MSSEKFGGGPENPGRRGFLKAMAGGAAIGALGVAGVNVFERESDMNQLHEGFKNREGDPQAANEAAVIILEEMNANSAESVKLISGTEAGFGTERLDIARDFLTKYINSPAFRDDTLRKNIIGAGVYTRENLTEILSATTR